ncbi:MAG TPA: PAS domain-containing protein [Rhizomicrobium sp.]|jgi:hypothetical protein|nr:PAS domain-containing protein [Rhizomicrobium sp.]
MTLPHRSLRRAPENLPELVGYYARVDAPRHPSANRLFAYWRDCVAARGIFVVGRDVPARPIANLLCNIVINEPLADGSDMRVRLAGTSVRRRFGGDIRGHKLSELFSPEDFSHHVAASFEAVRTGKPVILDSSLKRGGVEELHTEVLLLPVKSGDLQTDWLLVGIFYFN